MSIRAITWAFAQFIPNTQAKLVLVALADFHNAKDNKCHPKMATLAAKACSSERSVREALALLKKLGLLKTEQRWRGGSQASNQYDLQLDQTVLKAAKHSSLESPATERQNYAFSQPSTTDFRRHYSKNRNMEPEGAYSSDVIDHSDVSDLLEHAEPSEYSKPALVDAIGFAEKPGRRDQ